MQCSNNTQNTLSLTSFPIPITTQTDLSSSKRVTVHINILNFYISWQIDQELYGSLI